MEGGSVVRTFVGATDPDGDGRSRAVARSALPVQRVSASGQTSQLSTAEFGSEATTNLLGIQLSGN
jgi:hypothetical protein